MVNSISVMIVGKTTLIMNNKQKHFENFIQLNQDEYEEDGDPIQEDTYFGGWENCKLEVLNILNSLHSAPNAKVSLNEIIAIMKEKL